MGRAEWYGSFAGGDPRCFKPDPECTMPEEAAQWKSDCEAADCVQVGRANEPPASGFVTYPDGTVIHEQRVMYGLGVNHERPGPWRRWATELVMPRGEE